MDNNCETTLEVMHRFAWKNKAHPGAAEALMSFCRGECVHFYTKKERYVFPDRNAHCELCDHKFGEYS